MLLKPHKPNLLELEMNKDTEIARLKAELAEVKKALCDLIDCQNGAPLIQHKAEWEEAMRNAEKYYA